MHSSGFGVRHPGLGTISQMREPFIIFHLLPIPTLKSLATNRKSQIKNPKLLDAQIAQPLLVLFGKRIPLEVFTEALHVPHVEINQVTDDGHFAAHRRRLAQE